MSQLDTNRVFSTQIRSDTPTQPSENMKPSSTAKLSSLFPGKQNKPEQAKTNPEPTKQKTHTKQSKTGRKGMRAI